jgi:hypothetical protein
MCEVATLDSQGCPFPEISRAMDELVAGLKPGIEAARAERERQVLARKVDPRDGYERQLATSQREIDASEDRTAEIRRQTAEIERRNRGIFARSPKGKGGSPGMGFQTPENSSSCKVS